MDSSVSQLVLAKVYGAALIGLVLGAGVGARAATITTGKTKHHSAGTTRVATKVTAHTASRTGVKSSGAKRTVGTKTSVTTHSVATRTVADGHGARPTLAGRRQRDRGHFSAR